MKSSIFHRLIYYKFEIKQKKLKSYIANFFYIEYISNYEFYCETTVEHKNVCVLSQLKMSLNIENK